MAVKSISIEEFDSFGPARGAMIGVFILEKGWFADSNRNIIGTLTFDQTDKQEFRKNILIPLCFLHNSRLLSSFSL